MKMITILSAVSALVLFLTSCGTSENKEEETTFTEGMDTVCTVTGYHTLVQKTISCRKEIKWR